MREALESLLREIETKERQNRRDVKDPDWGGDHTRGFADAQRWVAQKMREILKLHE